MAATSQVLLALAIIAVFVWLRKRKSHLPPGPKGLPIFGVTFAMLDNSVKAWTRFERWERQHGTGSGLITVPTFARTNIVIRYT